MVSHWVLGAGQAGCMYDYGPNAHSTRRAALEDAAWYMEGLDLVAAQDVLACKRDLRRNGIHWFPQHLQPLLGDYIELSKHPGHCPKEEEDV